MCQVSADFGVLLSTADNFKSSISLLKNNCNFIMKKTFIISFLATVTLLASSGCKPEAIKPSAVALNKTELELVKGESFKLEATVTPDNAEYDMLTWSTSNKDVVTVDAAGQINAVSVGEAKVTVTVSESLFAECKVTVRGKDVESVDLDIKEAEMMVGEQLQLTATVLPEDAEDKTLTWSSSDAGILEVSETGLVTAINPGSASVTVSSGDKTASCNIVVNAPALVGDYFYSDGTYSTELDNNKQCIGIVFAVGHNENDASDYSSTGIGKAKCNGYVVALTDATPKAAMWGPKGLELGCYPKDEFGDPIANGGEEGKTNDWSGYMYCQLAKQSADSNGGLSPDKAEGHPLFYYAMVAYNETVAAPENTSGWFMPSISQMFQMVNVKDKFDTVEGAAQLKNDWYASSSESSVDAPGPADYFRYLSNMTTPPFISSDGKDGDWFLTRSVLAF